MLATNNTIIENAAETIYRLSADEAIREQCEAREDYYRLQRTIQKEIDQQKIQIDEQKTQIEQQQTQLEQQNSFLARDMRHEDLQRACVDEDFLKELLDEYHI